MGSFVFRGGSVNWVSNVNGVYTPGMARLE
jgi:hypothetical protein